MKKYYLQPTWDIIPDEKGAVLTSLTDDYQIKLKNSKNYPHLVHFFDYLKNGISDVELEKLSLLPQARLTTLLHKLEEIGLVAQESSGAQKKRVTNYLDLLKNHLVGPGHMVTKIYTHTASNLTFSKSLGFAPRFILHQSSLNEGWGSDKSSLMADIKAVVEGVERYSLANYDLKTLPIASWEEMKGKSLSPTQLGTYVDQLNTAPIHWCEFENLNKSTTIFVPLDFTYHPVDYWKLGRYPVCPMNISGVAAHQTKEAATTNALLELCEHEALMVAWYGKRTTPTVKLSSIDGYWQECIHSVQKLGWKIILKDISLDLASVVMAVGLGPKGKRALTIGSCAAFSLKYAVGKAISEVIRTILDDEITNPSFTPITKEGVNDTYTHGLYYASHKYVSEAAFLWEGGEEIEASDLLTHGKYKGQSLEKMVKLWEEKSNTDVLELDYLAHDVLGGLDIFIRDITPQEIKQAGIPLVVIKALIPETARFVVGYNQIPIQTDRYKKLVNIYDLIQDSHTSTIPHPFS